MTLSVESVPVEVTLRGNVGSGAGNYARGKVSAVLGTAYRPVRYAKVVLDWRHNPAVERHAIAEATIDVDGTVVRAKCAAPTMTEAVDEVESRLRRQLVQLRDRTKSRFRWTGETAENEWRRGAIPRTPVTYFPRPAESREVIRRKSFASAPMTVDEAAYEMDLLDHDFFLYYDLDADGPALVHRTDDGGYAVQGGPAEFPEGCRAVHEPGPPTLTEDEARTRLESDGSSFVFYLDAESGEGRVLYLRYDGHYGLITIAA